MIVLLATCGVADAAPDSLVVLYPQTGEPQAAVYKLLREGVAQRAARAQTRVVELSVGPRAPLEGLLAGIRAARPGAVIALGRDAFDATTRMRIEAPLIVWGIDVPVGNAGGFSGISLYVDPYQAFRTLREVAPGMRRVLVVIDPATLRWWREPAERAARALSLQLVLYEARSIGEAAAHYLNILRYGNPQTDSLWLLGSEQFVTGDTLPTIVEESWSRDFLVFSSVLDHVSKGVLFAHYPDARAIGEDLAGMAFDSSRRGRVEFLRSVRRAANIRVARHLAPKVDVSRADRFDLVLGER